MHLDSVAVALHFQGRGANDKAGTYVAVDYRHSGTEEDRNVALPFRRHLATAGTARREVLRIQSREIEREIRAASPLLRIVSVLSARVGVMVPIS